MMNAPPIPRIFDYPAATSAVFIVVLVTVLLFGVRFDPTGGPLTISLMVVLAMIGVIAFSLFFTVPNDEVTAAVVGGLTAAFGAVIAFWLGHGKGGSQ